MNRDPNRRLDTCRVFVFFSSSCFPHQSKPEVAVKAARPVVAPVRRATIPRVVVPRPTAHHAVYASFYFLHIGLTILMEIHLYFLRGILCVLSGGVDGSDLAQHTPPIICQSHLLCIRIIFISSSLILYQDNDEDNL